MHSRVILIQPFFFFCKKKVVNLVDFCQFPQLKVSESCYAFFHSETISSTPLKSWYLKRQSPLCAAGERCGDSPCAAEEFTCENGCCLDRALECDSTPQCSDNSDEKHCAECEQWLCQPHFIIIHAHGNLNTTDTDASLKDLLTWIMSCVLIRRQKLSDSVGDPSEWTKRFF